MSRSNIEELCDILSVEPEVFENILRSKMDLLIKMIMPKKRGGYRVVYRISNESYRNLLKTLLQIIETRASFHECAHGFLPGRSIITNASQHLGKQTLVNVDIKRFFDSITQEQVLSVFKQIGFKDEHAALLAEIACVKQTLVTGFPTSPIISNLVCWKLDQDFSSLADRYQATYTRYADDISISGNATMPSRIEIEKILLAHDFKMNQKKYKVQKKGGNQYVTGLTVCDPKKPHLSKRLKRRLRLETYYIRKYSQMSHVMYHLKRYNLIPQVLPMSRTQETALGWSYFAAPIDPAFSSWLGQRWGAGPGKRDIDYEA